MTDPFVRAARVVGDLDSPFYDEERQRDVWNEACAFGLQLLLWTSLLTATVTVWTVGADSVPYVLGGLLLIGGTSALTIAYAARLGVDGTDDVRVLRLRLLPYAVLVVALAAGLLRAGELGASTARGLLVGAGGAVLGLLLLRAARRRRRG